MNDQECDSTSGTAVVSLGFGLGSGTAAKRSQHKTGRRLLIEPQQISARQR
jgi:hypothetical protein